MKKISLVIGSRIDKTEDLARWCKEHNAVMWCHTQPQAKEVKEKYGIETFSPERNTLLKGMNKPVAINDFFFHPIIMKFLSFASYQARGKIEITLDKEGEVFELKMVTDD